jgi:hypothetical protein
MWILNVEGFEELATNAKGCVEKIRVRMKMCIVL